MDPNIDLLPGGTACRCAPGSPLTARKVKGTVPVLERTSMGTWHTANRPTNMSAWEDYDFSGTRSSFAAIRPNSGSDRAFIFLMARLRWTFTVVSVMPMSPAICLLRRPRAT